MKKESLLPFRRRQSTHGPLSLGFKSPKQAFWMSSMLSIRWFFVFILMVSSPALQAQNNAQTMKLAQALKQAKALAEALDGSGDSEQAQQLVKALSIKLDKAQQEDLELQNDLVHDGDACGPESDRPCVEITDVAAYESVADFFSKIKIDGQIRSYYFTQAFGPGSPPDRTAYSLGGYLNMHTPSIYGFSGDVGFNTANSLGTHGSPDTVDTTLAGLNASLTVLTQAYLQYELPSVLTIRAGNQSINSPWINPSDSRMIPASYQGFYGEVSPVENVHLYGMRIYRWKSRTSPHYYNDNLYYKLGFDGDPMYSGNRAELTNAPTFDGTLAFGADAEYRGARAEVWYYDFYQFAKMLHADVNYHYQNESGVEPYVEGQFVHEWEANSLLNSNAGYLTNQIDGFTGNSVKTFAWGVRTGVNYDVGGSTLGEGNLSWAFNKIDYNAGAVGGGAIVSPYTNGYATDPLYTTSMIRGLVEMGPGNAWKVSWTQHLWDKRFRFTLSYADYHLQRAGGANDEYLDLVYSPKGVLEGLSIRDRLEVAHGNLGVHKGHFLYNRVMLTYSF